MIHQTCPGVTARWVRGEDYAFHPRQHNNRGVPQRPSRWLDRASVLLVVNPAHPDSMRVQALPTLMGVSEDDSFSVVLEGPLCGVNLKQSTGRYWPVAAFRSIGQSISKRGE
ncbi:hypothetical protein B0G77_8148 [Paraburkholderia sp. BL10I2N1]|nr:hypothetical protein B0G77_8148 [Paraburkholderia sp. BL10I2N1]